MDSRDQHAIDELFRKIETVQRQAGPRDAEAEDYLRSHLAQNPAAAYYMAQTVIVQEQALNAAQGRIEELESRAAPRSGGGLLDSLFGGGRSRQAPRYAPPRSSGAYGQPWGQPARGGMAGGGFLAGAAQTAMGVAGGVVLGSMLSDMLSPDEAATAGLDDTGGMEADAGADVADAGDAGGDFGGDFGDFG